MAFPEELVSELFHEAGGHFYIIRVCLRDLQGNRLGEMTVALLVGAPSVTFHVT